MKTILILLICTVAAQGFSLKKICLRENQVVPHKNCHQYYKCQSGFYTRVTCKTGHHFCTQKLKCVVAHEVDCGKRIAPTCAECETPISDNICSDNDLVPHMNCHQYYSCRNGFYEEITCETGKHFCTKKLKCDIIGSVDCGRRIVPECHDCHVSKPHGVVIQVKNLCPRGEFVAHHYCHQYYRCQRGFYETLTCEAGYHFCTKQLRCVLSTSVDCGHRIVPPCYDCDLEQHAVAVQPQSICSIGDLIPHRNCHQYYSCQRGFYEEVTCEVGHHFCAERLRCEISKTVDCGNRVILPIHSAPVVAIQAQGICNVGDLIPHRNCHQYYTCQRGFYEEITCEAGRYFCTERLRCEISHSVSCGHRIIPHCDDCEVTRPAVAVQVQPVCSRGEFVPHRHCHRYYHCQRGFYEEITCQTGHHFCTKRLRCEVSHSVDCGNRIVLPVHNAAVVAIQSHSICNSGDLIPHRNCHQYYTCQRGFYEEITCEAGRYFCTERLRCEISHSVSCGHRIIPHCDDCEVTRPAVAVQIQSVCSRGEFVPHRHCHRYYHCQRGFYEEITCQSGHHFCTKRLRCEVSHSVDCGNRIVLPVHNAAVVAIQSQSICNSGDLIPHRNCHQYYTCQRGFYEEITCEAGRYFCTERLRCEISHSVSCGHRIIPHCENCDVARPAVGLVVQAQPVCSRGEFVPHRHCHRYYHCQRGFYEEMTCQVGHHFCTKRLRCEVSHSVDCGNRIVIQASSAAVVLPTRPGLCPRGSFIPHRNCHQYYSCDRGFYEEITCESGRYFCTERLRCEISRSVDCGHRIAPDCIDCHRPTTLAVRSICSSGDLIPHRNCHQYYTCRSGFYEEVTCEVGHYFCTERLRCEISHSVSCGQRIIVAEPNVSRYPIW